jgi:hypothetical protein
LWNGSPYRPRLWSVSGTADCEPLRNRNPINPLLLLKRQHSSLYAPLQHFVWPFLILMYVQTYVRDSLCEPLALLLTTLPLCMFACSDPDFQLPGKTIGMYHSSNVLCTLLGGPLPEQELRFFSCLFANSHRGCFLCCQGSRWKQSA